MIIDEFTVGYYFIKYCTISQVNFLNPAIAGFYLQQPIFILSHIKNSANKNSKVFAITKIDLS